jgi:hypothetical protein
MLIFILYWSALMQYLPFPSSIETLTDLSFVEFTSGKGKFSPALITTKVGRFYLKLGKESTTGSVQSVMFGALYISTLSVNG